MDNNKKESILKSIKKGEVYAIIKSVSQSGMSRRILFFRIGTDYKDAPETDEGYIAKNYIEYITREIGELSGELKEGEYKQGGQWVDTAGLRVGGCGMDMVSHTLYNCLGKEWGGKYNLL